MPYVQEILNSREGPAGIVFVEEGTLCYLSETEYWIDIDVGHWVRTTIADDRQKSLADPSSVYWMKVVPTRSWSQDMRGWLPLF